MRDGVNQPGVVVIDYQTPEKRGPENMASIIALIAAMVSAAAMFVATEDALPGRVVLLAVAILGAAAGFCAGLVGLRRARSREGVGHEQAWVALIISGAILVLVLGFVFAHLV